MSKKKSFFNNGEKIILDTESREGRLFSTYSLIAKNRFRWNNLPPGIESHIIEEYLYNCGQVAFFESDKPEMPGFLCLPCTLYGDLNVYGEPLNFQATGIDYYKILKRNDMAWIKSSDDLTITRNQVEFYTDWIDDIEKTMRKNLEQLRQPDIIASNKNNEVSLRNMYQKVKEGEEPIFYDKDTYRGGDFPIQVLNRNVNNYLESLQKNKNDVMFELLTFLGVNNANTDKKERMIVDEVNVNNIHILMNLDIEYKNRKLACEEINKKFGLNVEVELVIEELQEKYMSTPVEDVKKEVNGKEVK